MERLLRRFHREAQSDGAGGRGNRFPQRSPGNEAAENLHQSATGQKDVLGEGENRARTKAGKTERYQQRRGFVETGIWECPANQLAVCGPRESGRARSLPRVYFRSKRIFFQPQADEDVPAEWRRCAREGEWKGCLLRPGDEICPIRAAVLAGNRRTGAEIGQRWRQLGHDNIAGKLRFASRTKSGFKV